MLAIMTNLLSNRIGISLHRMFATFHCDIAEYSNGNTNIICQ